MRRTFLLNENNQPVSALVSKDQKSVLGVGVGVVLLRDINLGALGVIGAGAKGWVEWCDPESGAVEVLMEGIEPALQGWNNTLVLVPFETDDIIDAIQCSFRCSKPVLKPVTTSFKSPVSSIRNSAPSTDVPQ